MNRRDPILEAVSFWLVPAAADREECRRVILELAGLHGGPRFEPHVTLHSAPSVAAEAARDVLAAASAASGPLELRVSGIAGSGTFTNALYLELEASAEIALLAERLRVVCPGPSDYVLAPHLSLLYGSLDPAAAARIARSRSWPGPRLRFDEVRAVAHASPLETREQVEGWRELCRVPLVAL